MSTQSSSQVDLAKLFSSVTRELKNNRQTLNASDEYNHNHGDNMVENFQLITQAVRESRGSTPSAQLAHASQMLGQRSQSGSAQLYAQGLEQASEQLRGQSAISSENAMTLVQSLMGGQSGQSPTRGGGMDLLSSLLGGQTSGAQDQTDQTQSGGDLLSSLLGGMSGGTSDQADPMQEQSTQPDQAGGGDLLGGILGSLLGGGSTSQPSQPNQGQASQGGGLDLNTLLTAGMAYFQATQQGQAPLQALVQAVMSGSQMQNSAHHSQSGQMVAQTLISTLGSMLSGGK